MHYVRLAFGQLKTRQCHTSQIIRKTRDNEDEKRMTFGCHFFKFSEDLINTSNHF